MDVTLKFSDGGNMEQGTKYDNIANMITILCKGYSRKELLTLTNLAARMQKDETFCNNYLKRLKLSYIKAIPKLKQGTYEKVRFSILHNSILSSLGEPNNNQIPLSQKTKE